MDFWRFLLQCVLWTSLLFGVALFFWSRGARTGMRYALSKPPTCGKCKKPSVAVLAASTHGLVLKAFLCEEHAKEIQAQLAEHQLALLGGLRAVPHSTRTPS